MKKFIKRYREIVRSLVIMIMAVTMLAVSFGWLYDEYIGTGASLTIGEIKHNVTIYDKNGNVINDNQQIYTLINEANLSNTSRNTMYIKIENTGTIDMEYGLTFTLDGELEAAGIMYYRLFEVTNDVSNTNQGSYGDKLKAYAANNQLAGDIERDISHPVSNMSLINNYIQIGDIEKTNGSDYVIYRFDYGVYQTVNTANYSGQQLAVHMNLYSSQIGTISNENNNGYTYEVQTEQQLRDVLNTAVSGDTIMLINDITINGTLNIPRRINLNLNGKNLTVTEDLIYEFVNTGDLNISVTGNSHLVVNNDIIFNTPKANITMTGANKNYDVVVGRNFTINSILSDEEDGFYFDNIRVVKSKTSLIPADVNIKSNTKVLIGTDVDLGVIRGTQGATNVQIVNNGNITQINLSDLELLEEFSKYQIYIYNLGEIYGILGSTGIVLPETATPYVEPGRGNTLIIKGITSGDFTVSGSINFDGTNITNNTEDVTVVPITDEDNSYIVYIKDSTVSVEGLLRQYFIECGFNDPYAKISQIRKLVIYTLNAQYVENEDFDFLASTYVPELENLNLQNARVRDNDNINAIKAYALAGKSTLRYLKLPKTVTSIGAYAFYNCPLGEIVADTEFSFLSIPQSVTNIGSYAFNASKYVEFAAVNPPTIGAAAFDNSANGAHFFVVDGTVESYGALSIIHDKNIHLQASLSDNQLYFVYPKNTGLGISYNVNNYLTSSILGIPGTLTYNGSDLKVTEVGPNAYRSLNIVSTSGVALQLSSNLTDIRDYAFFGLNLNSGNFNYVKNIGNYAFYETNINELIGNNIETIGDFAFYNVPNTRVSLPNVNSIGRFAFAENTNLYEMDLGTVSYIGDYAFVECPNLIKVYIRNTDSIFVNNSEEMNITIGSNAIDASWGSYADGRLRIYVPDGNSITGSKYLTLYKKLIPSFQNYIYPIGQETGNYTHLGISYNLNQYTVKEVTLQNHSGNTITGYEIISYQGADLTGSYQIPSTLQVNGITRNVISIGEGAYQNVHIAENNNINIINNSIINVGADAFNGVGIKEFSGTNVIDVGNRAFYQSGLNSSKLPNLEHLGDQAFADIESLVMVNIGSVKTIGSEALKNCVNLQQLFITSTSNDLLLTGDPFENMGANTDNRIRIYVAEDSVSYYKNLFNNFSQYVYNTGTIVGHYTGNLGYDIGEYSVREVTITDRNNSRITGYEIIEYHGADINGTYNIPTSTSVNGNYMNVISIGNNAYLNSVFAAETQIDINNNNILKVGAGAFKNATGLRHVTLNNVITIGDNAFDSSSITIGTFPKVYSIGSEAFNNATTLYKLDLQTVDVLGYHAISNAPKLYIVLFKVGDLALQFDRDAFYNCGYETNDRMRFYVDNGKTDDGERYVDIYRSQLIEEYGSYFFAYDLMLGSYIPTNIPEELDIGEYSLRSITLKDQNQNNVSGYEFVEYHGADTQEYYEFPAEISMSDDNLSATITGPNNSYGGQNNWTSDYAITIRNNGTETIDSWRVIVDTTDGGRVMNVNAYNSTATIGDNSVTFTNLSYNGNLYPGQSTTIQFSMTRQILQFTPIIKIVKKNTIDSDAIPVISIGKDAFRHAHSVTNHNFTINNDRILLIDDGAFRDFDGIEQIYANKVLTIGDGAFRNSGSLKIAEFKKVESIGTECFQDAQELASLNLGNITLVPDHALQRTYKMTQLYFNNVSALADTEQMNMSFGDNALTNMGTTAGSRLRIYVPQGSISSTLTFVKAYKNTLPSDYSPYVFESGNIVGSYQNPDTGLETGNYTVKTITIDNVTGWQIIDYHGPNIDSSFTFPNTLTANGRTYPVISIGDNAFSYVIVNSGYTWNLTLPSSIRNIGDYAFYQRDIESVSLGSLKGIGRYAFASIDDLLSVSIESVNHIDAYAFYLNPNLASVSLGTGIESIGNFAFYNSWSENSLTSFYITTAVPPTIEENTLPAQYWSGGTNSLTVYVPDLNVNAYRNAQYWRNYTISRIGSVYQNAYIYNIINGNEIEIIGYINNGNTTSLSIPANFTIGGNRLHVTSIKRDAFDTAASLTSITLPSFVNNLENGFLANNASVTNISVNSSNTSFRSIDGVLYDYNQEVLIRYPRGKTATSYTIPNNTKVIAYQAFLNCTNLTSITFNSNLLSISIGSFEGANNITTFRFSSNTPPYFSGFGALPLNQNMRIQYPNGANNYTTNAFYTLYKSYLTTY